MLVRLHANPTRQNEEEMWKTWSQNGKRPDDLRPLMKSLQPLVQQTVNKYRAADVSTPALQAQSENQLVQGLHSYDPSKGSLTTHLNWQMRGVGRFVEKHQNFSRIPGSRIRSVGKYLQAKSTLGDEFGRPATLEEIAKRSKIPLRQATKLERELAPVHLMGMMVDAEGAPLDVSTNVFSADRERIELIYPDLSPQEQLVVDYSLGRSGKPKITSNKELARTLGVTDARISNIRASIARKSQALSWIR